MTIFVLHTLVLHTRDYLCITHSFDKTRDTWKASRAKGSMCYMCVVIELYSNTCCFFNIICSGNVIQLAKGCFL